MTFKEALLSNKDILIEFKSSVLGTRLIMPSLDIVADTEYGIVHDYNTYCNVNLRNDDIELSDYMFLADMPADKSMLSAVAECKCDMFTVIMRTGCVCGGK